MTIIPWSRQNQNELSRLHNDMDTLFDQFFGGLGRPFQGYKAWPAIDVADKDGEIVVRAEVPGCKPEDVDISVYGDTLTISGEKKDSRQEKGDGWYHKETTYGSFRREVALPTEIDEDKVEAVYKDGVLSVTLPKAEKTKAVKVKVQS